MLLAFSKSLSTTYTVHLCTLYQFYCKLCPSVQLWSVVLLIAYGTVRLFHTDNCISILLCLVYNRRMLCCVSLMAQALVKAAFAIQKVNLSSGQHLESKTSDCFKR